MQNKEASVDRNKSHQKKFILFNQTGNTSRVFFPPRQYPMKEMDSPSMDRKGIMRNSKEPIEANYLAWKAGCHGNEETVMALAFAALQKTRASRWNSVSLGNFGDELIPESGEGKREVCTNEKAAVRRGVHTHRVAADSKENVHCRFKRHRLKHADFKETDPMQLKEDTAMNEQVENLKRDSMAYNRQLHAKNTCIHAGYNRAKPQDNKMKACVNQEPRQRQSK